MPRTEKRKEFDRKYYYKNREKIIEYNKNYAQKCLNSWEGVIPTETTCEICGKTIYYNKKNPRLAIHFDHREGIGKTGYKTPANWLLKHKRTPENEVIWKSFNFGCLCLSCNSHLPTINRNAHLENMVKYVFGKGANIAQG